MGIGFAGVFGVVGRHYFFLGSYEFWFWSFFYCDGIFYVGVVFFFWCGVSGVVIVYRDILLLLFVLDKILDYLDMG